MTMPTTRELTTRDGKRIAVVPYYTGRIELHVYGPKSGLLTKLALNPSRAKALAKMIKAASDGE
jgi:hypothetical protein